MEYIQNIFLSSCTYALSFGDYKSSFQIIFRTLTHELWAKYVFDGHDDMPAPTNDIYKMD